MENPRRIEGLYSHATEIPESGTIGLVCALIVDPADFSIAVQTSHLQTFLHPTKFYYGNQIISVHQSIGNRHQEFQKHLPVMGPLRHPPSPRIHLQRLVD